MDIIVTTPKSEIANSAREAADCLAAGGREYFRRFGFNSSPTKLDPGDRVYYLEDGYIRGFAIAERMESLPDGGVCVTTGRQWPPGFYVFMRADSWKWIRPIPMKGFQGFRYSGFGRHRRLRTKRDCLLVRDVWTDVVIVGGWRDPKPETP